METQHTDLFRIVLMLNCFVLFLSFTGVKSAVSKSNIMDIMKNDPKLCPTSKFLYDSEYTKSCASIAYPTGDWNYNPDTLNSFLCLGVNDTAYKICQYSSQLQNFLNSTAIFNSYVEKYVPNKNEEQEAFCNKLQGFTSLYNKTDSLWGQLVTNLNKPHKCIRICFDFQDKFHPLCAVFAWIKSIEDIQREKKIEIKQYSSDKPHINQLKDEMNDVKIISTESKKTSEANTQNRKQITADSNINNNVKEGDANVPDNIPLTNESNGEKTKSDIEKTSNIQLKINNTLEISAKSVPDKSVPLTFKENKEYTIDTEFETNAKVAKPIKDIPPNSDSQASSINNDINNINKKVVNEKNIEKSNKEQDTDDFKTSTLSENTQDHYDGNPDENMENDADDIDETPHPDTGNQNENVQGTFEQKNNNARLTEYSDARTEDDSHFFTYFTVITLACLAGYIGYHNKQKILAIVLEGRRSRSNRGRRRPSTASYRKLDCTLEEAVTSQCNANVTHVIY